MEQWQILNENGMFDVSLYAELKPCPFCGGRPYIDFLPDRFHTYFILCSKCMCRMQVVDIGLAVRDWNKRYNEANEEKET